MVGWVLWLLTKYVHWLDRLKFTGYDGNDGYKYPFFIAIIAVIASESS